MGRKSYDKRSPYYVKLPDENIIRYIRRFIKSIIEMYPHAREHGLRYYTDTQFRRKISYDRKKNIRRHREGAFNRSDVRAKLKTRLIDRSGHTCNICKSEFARENLTIDHIIPLFTGGRGSDIKNLQLLCNPCHVQKTKEDIVTFKGKFR
jgi:5-methylcytosine-specific restriction endonuclease McrA